MRDACAQVGVRTVLAWFGHYCALGAYALLAWASRPLRKVLRSYRAQRLFEAWQWGSGADYSYSMP